jgi:CHAT domain-containing protein/uncharacterized protein HemY
MPLGLKSTGFAIAALLLSLTTPLYPTLHTLAPVFAQIPATSTTKAEADQLLQQGIEQFETSQFEAALQSWQQALTLYRQLKNRLGERKALGNLGLAYSNLGNYPKAIDYHQQSLAIAREIKDRPGEEAALNNLGNAYRFLGDYPKAIDYHQQSLAIAREIKDRLGEGQSLGNLGSVYDTLGDYPKAIDYHQRSLAIFREIKDRAGEGKELGNLGGAYYFLGDYTRALDYYQQSLAIERDIKDRLGERQALGNLGSIYLALGDYTRAIDYHQQSLAIAREIKDRLGEGNALSNLGSAYDALRDYPQAIDYHQQSLAIAREIKNRQGEGQALNALGHAYRALALWAYPQAIDYHQQSLAIAREIKDRLGEETALADLGSAYGALGDYPKAIEYLQQSLAIAREIKDREGEGISLSHLGRAFAEQNQSELAIALYKQSINVRENIRVGLRPLSRDLQESYTQSVAYTYRQLADLLLEQGRLAEAQRVLELLKLQELKDFTRSSPVEGKQEIVLLQLEQQILEQYGSVIAFGQKLYECESKGQPCKDLRDKLDALTLAFNRESNTFTKTLRQRLAQDPAFLTSDQLGSTATDVVTAQPGTVLIYPLVLDNKLRLLLATRAGETGVAFRTVEVSHAGQQQLWKTVSRFRELLQTPDSNLKELQQVSGQLYDWLIRPLEKELGNQQVRHLVFALDRATRYIPMGALFDGKQYLIQKYAVSTILAAELTDTRDRLPTKPEQISVLALGVSNAVGEFKALPNVPDELKAIVRDRQLNFQGIYQGLGFLNETFDYSALRDNLRDRQIVHIATHGKFEPGRPENSFILPGKGNPLTIEEIQKLQNYMRDVHLVVLSACQTAVGGPDESGIEIPGISFYFLKNRVKAVIASLWLVNDASTSQLMQQFYQNLAIGSMSKAEALRQAQVSMITDKSQSNGTQNSRSSVIYNPGQSQAVSISRDLSHPYYWAPFILIGNGL